MTTQSPVTLPDQTSEQLMPATTEDIEHSLAFALRYDGRKRHSRGDEFMARLMAEHLVRHLTDSGFVIMKRPARRSASVTYDRTGRQTADFSGNPIEQ